MTGKTWLPDPDNYTPTWADHHRCTATRTDGTRCRRNRMKGQAVCAKPHGHTPPKSTPWRHTKRRLTCDNGDGRQGAGHTTDGLTQPLDYTEGGLA